ncbi:hypothetical protein E2C01_084415 [Portunus trituberculatus]|uniref:Uncharacterized protein n=1 Tax=Portunus trituberculatus TaxID=210409 RepID=A0A5B7J400_PORTR|nr:hypothetical protein [Portunus trituberculatus]
MPTPKYDSVVPRRQGTNKAVEYHRGRRENKVTDLAWPCLAPAPPDKSCTPSHGISSAQVTLHLPSDWLAHTTVLVPVQPPRPRTLKEYLHLGTTFTCSSATSSARGSLWGR